MKHIKGLDTLRAYSIALVIIAHWGPSYTDQQPIWKFIQIFLAPDGSVGVTIFFVLSGFLITSILLDAKANSSTPNHFITIKNFFFRRALRIFPIYYLMIGFLYLVNYVDVRANIAYALTYTMNIFCYNTNSWNSISHTWTLCIEEQFYILWPWLILFTKDKYLKYLFILFIGTGIISSYYALTNGHIAPFLPHHCFDAFGIGGLYAYMRQDETRCRKFEKAMWVIGPASLAVFLYWQVPFYINQPQPALSIFRKTIISIVALWLIILIVNNRSAIMKKYLLENRFFNFIGKISYGLYLYHIPFLTHVAWPLKSYMERLGNEHQQFKLLFTNYAFYYTLSTGLLVLLAWLTFTLIEKPFLRIKKYFKYEPAIATT